MRENYRNKKYIELKCSDNYKTIVIVSKNLDILDYLYKYEKKVDYILNYNNIKIDTKYDDIEIIDIKKLLKLKKTYNIVIDDLNIDFLNQLTDIGFKIYYYENKLLTDLDRVNVDIKDNFIKYTNRVSIELSNICNYAKAHIKCPLHKQTEKKILPLNIIEKVIKELGEYNYSGTISFHTYNEPLIDPRLFHIISLTKKYCPNSYIYILTNGFYLNQEMANELVNVGVDRLDVTSYSDSEYDRLIDIDLDIPYSVFYSPKIESLDDRLDLYEENNNLIENSKPCYNVLNDLVITCDAKLDLCCFDWKREHIYGDLKKQSLKEIINSTTIYKDFISLAKGDRNNTICKNCINALTKNILDFSSSGITYRKNNK